MFFDTHAHYDDKAFDEDRDSLLAALPEAGVTLVIDPGCDVKSSRAAKELAARYEHVYAAVGIHPEELGDFTEENLNEIAHLARDGKCVAIGEIGLDYYWDDTYKAEQKELFRRQIELALELSKPIIVHDREAHGDTMDLLRKYRPKGTLHCFSGSVEMAREIIQLGLYIGLGGVVTFKNARHSVEVAAEIPLDRLLLETDAPYMAPVPFRGKRCDSSMIVYVADRIAQIRGLTTSEVLAATRENARRLYKIS